jgi:tetratricopeptide (TPR) repeat protein
MNPKNTVGLEVLEAVKRSDFTTLEQRLGNLHQRFERDEIPEKEFADALEGFDDDFFPEIVAPLNAWVAAYPKSYVALMARATHGYVEGHAKRGYDKANKTSQEQWQQMFQTLQKANNDALNSIDMTSKPTFSYMVLMRIESVGGVFERAKEYYQSSIAKVPNSLLLRRRWMSSLRPEWQGGGNFQMMDAFLNEPAQKNLPEADQRLLMADRYASEAHYAARFQDNLKGAIPLYEKAFSIDPAAFSYEQHGVICCQVKNYAKAIPSLEKAIELSTDLEPSRTLLVLARLRFNINDRPARVLIAQGAEGNKFLKFLQGLIQNPGFLSWKMRFIVWRELRAISKQ